MTRPSGRDLAADGDPPGRSQRQAVYAAEELVGRILDRSATTPVVEVAGSRLTLPPERHFADLDAVQRYVDAVLGLEWVRRRWPAAASRPVTVRERRGMTKAHYEHESATIAVPIRGRQARWALRELVVLHEIAHHLGAEGSGGGHDIGHGSTFAARLVELVDGVVGSEVALLLRVTFADVGVSMG